MTTPEHVGVARSLTGRHLATQVIAQGTQATVNAAMLETKKQLQRGRHPHRALQRAFVNDRLEFATVLAEHWEDAQRFADEAHHGALSAQRWRNPGQDV